MPKPPGPSSRARQRRAELASARRSRRLTGFGLLAVIALVILLLTAFGSGTPQAVSVPAPAPADRLLPAGPPTPEVIALDGALRIQLPVAQSRLTAIGYHATGDDAVALQPLGSQGNEGALARLAHRVFGGGSQGLRYYLLPGASGPATAALDVGASPGTDVYSPVDGTVVGLTPYIVNGRRYGFRIDIQPQAAPALVVSLSHLRPDRSLTVGSTVAAGVSKVGTIIDLSHVERQALAGYTQDAGNHVELQAHPAAVSATP